MAQKLDLGVRFGVMMTLPPEYTSKCDSCKAGFFGDFCEGKLKIAKKIKWQHIFNRHDLCPKPISSQIWFIEL